jgi:hypothetical protein
MADKLQINSFSEFMKLMKIVNNLEASGTLNPEVSSKIKQQIDFKLSLK